MHVGRTKTQEAGLSVQKAAVATGSGGVGRDVVLSELSTQPSLTG